MNESARRSPRPIGARFVLLLALAVACAPILAAERGPVRDSVQPIDLPTPVAAMPTARSPRLRPPAHAASDLFPHLDAIVQPIETITQRADGGLRLGLGSGFVVGERYYTVYHNLLDRGPSAGESTVSYVGGLAVRVTVASPEFDVAVIDLPDAVCRRLCNDLALPSGTRIEPGRTVVWLRKVGSERVLKSARVHDYAMLGASSGADWSCDDHLVVMVDRPFVPGSSGAPVLDAGSGEILGIIQGSFEWGDRQTGYFKPIECVVKLIDTGITG